MHESAKGGQRTIRKETVMSCFVQIPKVDDSRCISRPILTKALCSKYDSLGIVSTLTLETWSRKRPVCKTRKMQWFVHGKCCSSTNLKEAALKMSPGPITPKEPSKQIHVNLATLQVIMNDLLPIVRINPDKLVSASNVSIDGLEGRMSHQAPHRRFRAFRTSADTRVSTRRRM
jgi:hypothetical protein